MRNSITLKSCIAFCLVLAGPFALAEARLPASMPVSYTHLTLPTICSV